MDFCYRTIIPATVPTLALFDDGNHVPVICWALEDREVNSDVMSFVVGLIVELGSDELAEAPSMSGFKGYKPL